MDRIEIKKYDVDEFAKKLEQWSNDLPPAEHAVLAAIIAQASNIADAGEAAPQAAVVKFTVPVESILGRFVVDTGEERFFIKENGPSWVNSPRPRLGEWAEVVNPE